MFQTVEKGHQYISKLNETIFMGLFGALNGLLVGIAVDTVFNVNTNITYSIFSFIGAVITIANVFNKYENQ
jgi:uncharacterized membrane protein YeaQ/YmgE (transglycosylase-associated protein family)